MLHLDAVSIMIIIAGLLVCAAAVVLITIEGGRRRNKSVQKARKSGANDIGFDISRGEIVGDEVMVSIGNKKLAISSAQDIGKREQQQDSFGMYDGGGRLLLTVCDGMGGMAMGEESSKLAVETLVSVFKSDKSKSALMNAVKAANEKVYELCHGRGGTTCVAAVIDKEGLRYASVGDSRICLMKDGELNQLGRDHIFLYDLLENAQRLGITEKEAMEHPEREHLTSFIGRENLGRVNKNAEIMELKSGDVILLFTDGVYKTVSNDDINALVLSGASAQEIVSSVLSRDKARQDNLTVIKVRVV